MYCFCRTIILLAPVCLSFPINPHASHATRHSHKLTFFHNCFHKLNRNQSGISIRRFKYATIPHMKAHTTFNTEENNCPITSAFVCLLFTSNESLQNCLLLYLSLLENPKLIPGKSSQIYLNSVGIVVTPTEVQPRTRKYM